MALQSTKTKKKQTHFKLAEPKKTLNFIKNRIYPSPPPTRYMSKNPAYAKYSIGQFSYGYPEIISDTTKTSCKIGKFCSFANGVIILLGTEHRPEWVTTYPFTDFLQKEFPEIIGHPTTKGDVIIGNDVWIGMNAFIRSGVCIGDGAVIGANTVVARDVAPYSIVVGNPAKVLRKRFDDETIEKLLKIKWWDWSFKKIKENIPLLMSNRMDEFLERHYVETAKTKLMVDFPMTKYVQA